ncbi:MAG: hypothetical protein ACETWK_01690 [Candidatus Aminicenantaceae bacterium]
MNPLRKVIGLLIIIFIGLPVLFGVIWVVGVTKAAVSPEFVSELPREIIDDIPDLVEEVFLEAQDERAIADEDTRAWFQAAAKTGISPRELMRKIGLLDWLENELSESLYDVGEILRGERRPRTVVFDLIPLKSAFFHEESIQYLKVLIQNLPPCDYEEEEVWERAEDGESELFTLPPCRPDMALAEKIIRDEFDRAVVDMPDEVEILRGVRFVPFGISRTVTLLSYSFFIIPAVLIFIGALIAATSASSFFRWSGISFFVGGLIPLILSLFVMNITPLAIKLAPYSWWSETWTTDLQELILEKTSWIHIRIVDHLISPVATVAGIVCIVGVALFVISFIVRGKKKAERE